MFFDINVIGKSTLTNHSEQADFSTNGNHSKKNHDLGSLRTFPALNIHRLHFWLRVVIGSLCYPVCVCHVAEYSRDKRFKLHFLEVFLLKIITFHFFLLILETAKPVHLFKYAEIRGSSSRAFFP